MSNTDSMQHAKLERAAKTILNTAAERLKLSARGYMRVIKIARTIADIDQSEIIGTQHIAEALHYRSRGTAVD